MSLVKKKISKQTEIVVDLGYDRDFASEWVSMLQEDITKDINNKILGELMHKYK